MLPCTNAKYVIHRMMALKFPTMLIVKESEIVESLQEGRES